MRGVSAKQTVEQRAKVFTSLLSKNQCTIVYAPNVLKVTEKCNEISRICEAGN